MWENIFSNDISDKGFFSKVYKELIQLDTRKTHNPIKKWAKDLNRHLSKEDIEMAHRRKIKMLTVTITEIHIKTAPRQHLTPARTATSIKQQTTVLAQMRRKGSLCALLVGMQTGAAAAESSVEIPQKIKNDAAFWEYTLRIAKHQFKRIHAPPCSQQHYLQSPTSGNSPSACQWMSG